MKHCSACRHSKLNLFWMELECHRNSHTEEDPVDGSMDIHGVVDCTTARTVAWLEDKNDARYCGPEGKLWQPK